ncbi:MAG: universal stress protein [Chloroflexi bacterium]|nr:universal stress protein [Chloroflexota bacterium]
MHTLVVPLDGSRLAARVLPHVTALAAAFGSRLHLVSVIDVARLDLAFYYQHYALPLTEAMQLWLARALDRERRVLERGGCAVTTEVALGRPAETVLRVAHDRDAHLIALSTHGRGGLGRWALGSVAHDLVRSSTVPLLLHRPQDRVRQIAYRRLLLPLDGSSRSEAALPLAQRLAQGLGARLLLAQVVPTALNYALGPHWTVIPLQLEEQAVAAAQVYLHEVCERLAGAGVAAEAVVLRGDPARQLLDLAEQQPIDLTVMATHGHGGVRHLALGSVADRVVQASARPVVLVPPSPAATGTAEPGSRR